MFKGHKNGTFYVKACLSPDGRYLLSGSSDEHAYIWDTCNLKGDKYLPIVKLVGHSAEVTSVAWCPVGEVKVLLFFYFFMFLKVVFFFLFENI